MSSPIGIRVPKGGSNCKKCKYSVGDGENCANHDYIMSDNDGAKRPGDTRFIDGKTGGPVKGDEFCCNFFDWDAPSEGRSPLDVYAGRLARQKR